MVDKYLNSKPIIADNPGSTPIVATNTLNTQGDNNENILNNTQLNPTSTENKNAMIIEPSEDVDESFHLKEDEKLLRVEMQEMWDKYITISNTAIPAKVPKTQKTKKKITEEGIEKEIEIEEVIENEFTDVLLDPRDKRSYKKTDLDSINSFFVYPEEFFKKDSIRRTALLKVIKYNDGMRDQIISLDLTKEEVAHLDILANYGRSKITGIQECEFLGENTLYYTDFDIQLFAGTLNNILSYSSLSEKIRYTEIQLHYYSDLGIDKEIIDSRTFRAVKGTFSNLMECLQHENSLLDSLMYFSFPEDIRKSMSIKVIVEDYERKYNLNDYVREFTMLFMMVMIRGKMIPENLIGVKPSDLSKTEGEALPKILLSYSPTYPENFRPLITKIDPNKFKYTFAKHMDLNILPEKMRNRLNLSCAGFKYIKFIAGKTGIHFEEKSKTCHELINIMYFCSEVVKRQCSWSLHPSCKDSNLINVLGSLNLTLSYFIQQCFSEEQINKFRGDQPNSKSGNPLKYLSKHPIDKEEVNLGVFTDKINVDRILDSMVSGILTNNHGN